MTVIYGLEVDEVVEVFTIKGSLYGDNLVHLKRSFMVSSATIIYYIRAFNPQLNQIKDRVPLQTNIL